MVIRLPRQITPYPDRELDCQAALEDTYKHILSPAERSGWSRTEAIEALRELSWRRIGAPKERTSPRTPTPSTRPEPS